MPQAPPLSFEAACTRRVTYVLITRNRSAYLRTALENARQLKGPEDELIVVDGGSKDDSVEVVKAAGDLVDLLISEPDISEAHAVNKGYLHARGRYVKELTDDDVIHPEGMAAAIRIMDENPDVELLVCGGTKQHGSVEQTICLPPGTNYGKSAEDVFRYGTCGIGWLIRKSLFARIGLMPPKAVSLDRAYTAYAIASGADVRFARVNMYHHPVFPHSYSNSRQREMQRDVLRLVREYTTPAFARRYRLQLLISSLADRGVVRSLAAPLRARRAAAAMAQSSAHAPQWDGGFS